MVVKGDSLSAPVEFNFTAIANTPVAAMFNWKIYRKDEGGGSSEGNEEGEENNGTLLRDFSGEENSTGAERLSPFTTILGTSEA